MVDQLGRVKITDLGISKEIDEAQRPKQNRIAGTPQYMAPEAALGENLDARSDLYSLGVTLFHLVVGKAPYRRGDVSEILKQHISAPIPNPQDIRPEVPDSLARLIVSMMAKDL